MILRKRTTAKGFESIDETTEIHVFNKGKEFFKENRRISIQNLVENQTNWIDIKAERKQERKSKRIKNKDIYSY
jgi:hypothetical protein